MEIIDKSNIKSGLGPNSTNNAQKFEQHPGTVWRIKR
jgi:hypothetical protein